MRVLAKAPNYTIEILDDRTLKYTSDGRYFYFNSDKGEMNWFLIIHLHQNLAQKNEPLI